MNPLANIRRPKPQRVKKKPIDVPVASTSRLPVPTQAINRQSPSRNPAVNAAQSSRPTSALPDSRSPDVLRQTLGIPEPIISSKISKKHLSLKNPEGKTSSLRLAKKQKQKEEKEKLRRAKIRGFKVRGLIPKEERKAGQSVNWVTALGLRALWLGYMAEVLGLELEGSKSLQESARDGLVEMDVDGNDLEGEEGVVEVVNRYHAQQQGFTPSQVQGWQSKLVKADYHGALIKVKQSMNTSTVGLEGIVLQESEGTFSVVTRKNCIKVLPKHGSIFTFSLALRSAQGHPHRELNVDLSGTHFAHRDRVGRKWKPAKTGEFDPSTSAMYF